MRRAALRPRRARWESHCRRCGLCCYEKERRGSTVVTDYRHPCVYLDVATRLCTVYEKRFAVCAQCRPMTLFHALFVTWLPPTCGYVRRYRRARGGKVSAPST
jgi:uncharacterized cysteine cluster protein YcgN (CxxCxxCC family)